ncbi:MAG TPA: hypothetical protein VHY77_07885 [Acidimicrobiales bacterium]|nr:hypothetical protein [Acidimicrobiales bacterium]
MVTLLADDDEGAATPEDPELCDEVSDEDVPDDAAPDTAVVADRAVPDDAVTWVVDGVAACDESDAARAADPAVRAIASPAMPAVICLTRRRARWRRVAASLWVSALLGLRTAS